MDWKIFLSTFVTIFLAEMGDKTQFAALAASSNSRSTWSVLIAVVMALALAGSLGVFFGRILGALVEPQVLKYCSGFLFIAVGVWVILAKH